MYIDPTKTNSTSPTWPIEKKPGLVQTRSSKSIEFTTHRVCGLGGRGLSIAAVGVGGGASKIPKATATRGEGGEGRVKGGCVHLAATADSGECRFSFGRR